MQQTGEPSVDEILASIKKVIARDNRAGAAEERRQRETEGVTDSLVLEEELEEDVLDLAESAEELVTADEQDQEQEHELNHEYEPEPEPEEEREVPLLTANAQANMRESLAALAMLSEPGAQPQIVRSGETSLEGLTRELLRPALSEWLDKNLPPLVERMVAAEISRIVGKRG